MSTLDHHAGTTASSGSGGPHHHSASTFGLLENELRGIDEDYNAGRMNAFGVSSTHDEIMKEMKKVSELELQVFYKTTEMLRAAGEGDEPVISRALREHTDHTRVTASMTGLMSTNNTAAGSGEGGDDRVLSGSPNPSLPNHTPTGGGGDSGHHPHFTSAEASPEFSGDSRLQPPPLSGRGHTKQMSSSGVASSNDETGTPRGGGASNNNGNHTSSVMLKLTDQSFEEIGKVFKTKEAALRSLGENMREMQRHVNTVTELTASAHEQNIATSTGFGSAASGGGGGMMMGGGGTQSRHDNTTSIAGGGGGGFYHQGGIGGY